MDAVILPEEQPPNSLPNPVNLQAQTNRARRMTRPRNPPNDPGFILEDEHIEPGFLLKDIHRGNRRHLLFGSGQMLDVLKRAQTWLVPFILFDL